MRLTIVRDDDIVIIDGEGHGVDCSKLPNNFHALQWDGTRGEVEYVPQTCSHCGVRSKKGNEILSDVTAYQTYVDAWHAAKKIAEEKAALAENSVQHDAA